ncbi:MAG: helix-turn-helix transcriptional regulator [Natronosporangium sp.]
MPVHVFTLVLNRRPDDQELDALLAAGCDDATFGVEHGAPIAQFDRDAPAMADAIASAVRDIESAGLRVLRVLDEDLLTLADIADRAGRSRESIRRYATGERGGGGFPLPANPGREGTVFYRWSEVAPWLRDRLGIDIPDTDPALVVANLVLQARQHRDRVVHMSALNDLLAA